MRARILAVSAVALCIPLWLAPPSAALADDAAPAPGPARTPSASTAPSAPPARWDQGEPGRRRRAHLLLTLSLGALYGASEVIFKDALSPDTCRWCRPPGFDASTRDALVWNDVETARTLSDVAAYGALPLLTLGVSIWPALHEGTGGAAILDAVVPVLESAMISQSLAQLAKFSVGRQRPYARFGDPPPAATSDDNLSFFSAHSSFVFSLVTSSATAARLRGSRAEPVLWAVGLPLAAATGALRIAGDKHYLSDVLVGAAVGAGTGLVVPRWYRSDVTVVPTGRGVALAGRF